LEKKKNTVRKGERKLGAFFRRGKRTQCGISKKPFGYQGHWGREKEKNLAKKGRD